MFEFVVVTGGPVDQHDHQDVLRAAAHQGGQEPVEVARNATFDLDRLADPQTLAPRLLVLADRLNGRFDFIRGLERPSTHQCHHAGQETTDRFGDVQP